MTVINIGYDASGNGNNWTPNNINFYAANETTYDSMLDVPTQFADGGNGRGNYATLNPLITGNVISTLNANLNVSLASGANAYFSAVGTIAVASGKWYWECAITARDSGGGQWFQFGIVSSTTTYTNNPIGFSGGMSAAYAYYNDGAKAGNGTSTSGYGATFTTNDVIGIAFDEDNGTITFYKNGVSQGQAFSGISTLLSWYPIIQIYRSTGTTQAAWINLGQRPFAYTPPTGFKALNTLNLPAPTILKGNQYFDATTYTGTGASLAVTNSGGFQPDFVWIKNRSTTNWHQLYDSVRGVQKALYSNATDAEATETQGLLSFNTNGMTVGTNAGINGSGNSIVGWQWRANGTPAVTNTAGSITSTISAGATQGFSIVTYTGTGANATVGHGLGVAPRMIITKARNDATYGWTTYHVSVGAGACLFLNTTGASNAGINIWNNTAPTSSVFSVGTDLFANQNTTTYVAYCFDAVAGFSAFGSYTGNGSADGPFVFCGFRPEFVMIKNATGTASANTGWYMFDTARNTFNVMANPLLAQVSDAEQSGYAIDFLSNGFKLRMSDSGINSSAGATHIYMAFAETPFKNALAR